MRSCLPLLLVALFGLNAAAGEAVARGLPKAGTLDGLGVNIHFTHAKAGELEMLAAGGFRFVRMDFGWEGCEREKGVYDFAAYDHLLGDLERLGLRAYFILDYGHRFYDGGLSPHTDAGRAAFCAFVTAAMKHFAGRGIVWEMWNEPNISFWKPKPNADDYAKLAFAVGETIRAVAPQELFVGPTTSEVDLAFMETCFKAGCLAHWDAVSVHPYRHRVPETVAEDYRTMRQLIHRHLIRLGGDTRKDPPILSGEWGYSSSVEGWGKGYDEQRQGRYLSRQWLSNIANEVLISIWYDWHDDGTNPKEAEDNFGTVRNPYRAGQAEVYEPKPAYVAAKTLTTVLQGYEFSKALALADDEHVLLFAKGDQLRLAAWTSADAPRTVTIPASPGRFRVTGHLGQELPEVTADAQGLKLTLTGDVQYLAPITANPSLRMAVAWDRLRLEEVITAFTPRLQSMERRSGKALIEPEITERLLNTRFTNPLEHPVMVEGRSDALEPGKSCVLTERIGLTARDPLPPAIRMGLTIDQRLVWTQTTAIMITNPVYMRILPPTAVGNDLSLPIVIDNREGTDLVAQMEMSGTEPFPQAAPISITALAGGEFVYRFPLHQLPGNRFRLGLLLKGGTPEFVIRTIAPRWYQPIFTSLDPGAWTIYPDGDPKVASTQRLKADKADVMPGLSDQPSLDLDYHLDKGWKFLRIAPKAPIDLGAAKEIGMWVFGDGSGNIARLRVTDASGQVFQPEGGRLTHSGWKWLTFTITPHTSHWGGANDGVAKAPLKLDTLFRLDHGDPSQASGGTIRIAGAMAVE